MADVIEINVSTGARTERDYTKAEKSEMEASKPSIDEKWATIRSKRDVLLSRCDWWGSSDVTMSDAQTAYRKALRDLPASESNPDDIVFPSKP
tara:strand:- start:859 stop:1137 length:279 start_codon:yes stop_codon:yes gene_type:complete